MKENPAVWQPQIRSVAVFKNGLGFFLSDGEVSLQEGWCMAKDVPPAIFGTLAIFAEDEQQTVDIVGSGTGEIVEFDGHDAPDETAAKVARLEAAKHLRLELRFTQSGRENTATGKLLSVSPEFAVLENESTNSAVPVKGIKRMRMPDLPLRIHVQGADGKAAGKATVGMAYLSKGITWIPDYTLKVLDEETAELTLRGTLVNYATDLVHTDVQLVVGVPHFAHSEYMAPITVGQAIRSIGAAMAAQGVPVAVTSQLANRIAIVSNQHQGVPANESADDGAGRGGRSDAEIKRALASLPKFESAAASDYTVYTAKDITLRHGEKAILTLLTQKIKYTHRYRWSPPGAMQHALVLHNASGSSWTTGPCLALSGQQPLCEDLLTYTPAKARCELPVTTAINISHEKTEQEVERKMKAHSPGGDINFDLVVLEGKLQLHNFEKRAVELSIVNPVPGKPISAGDGGVMASDSTKLKLLEREGSISWRVKLEPGERKTLVYRYERYVLSR